MPNLPSCPQAELIAIVWHRKIAYQQVDPWQGYHLLSTTLCLESVAYPAAYQPL